MCLFPRKIVTPFNRISINGGQPLMMEVPCGRCAECKDKTRLEWHFRTYYQCEDFIGDGGFILYDTLTYAPEHLPMLSHFYDIKNTNIKDFSCFNHEHIKLFLKRLRRSLQYHFKGNIVKYFLTSEYGVDERFTHRPHYHILFFVKHIGNGQLINPLIFSRLVSHAWYYGRTDGLPYKPVAYVEQNIFADFGNYNRNLLRVSNYISKYVTKDSDFQKQLDTRIDTLKNIINDDALLKQFIRNISMFHRQSQGFGLSYIKYLSDDEYRFIYDNGACRISDPKKVTLTIPLPLYYKRKLFYRSIKTGFNTAGKPKISWIPTETGLNYIKDNIIRNITTCASSLKSDVLNMDDETRKRFYKLLGHRDLTDLAIYNLYYRYHSRDLNYLPQLLLDPLHKRLTQSEYHFPTYLNTLIDSKSVNVSNRTDFFERDTDYNTIEIYDFQDLFSSNQYKYCDLLKRITYDQDSCSAFAHFDELNNLIVYSKKEKNILKQRSFDTLEQLKKRYKVLFNYDNFK